MRICKFKIKNWCIDFNIYKKSTKIRGFKWFEIIPLGTFNSKGKLFSSLFFHLSIEKILFYLPDNFIMDNFIKYRDECVNRGETDLEQIKKEYLKNFGLSDEYKQMWQKVRDINLKSLADSELYALVHTSHDFYEKIHNEYVNRKTK